MYFKAKVNGDGSVTLKWKTAAEIDNAGFNIYRAKRKNGSCTKTNDVLSPAEGGQPPLEAPAGHWITVPGQWVGGQWVPAHKTWVPTNP